MIELVNKKSNVNLATPTIIVKEGGGGDLSNYYTKSEVDALIPDVSGFALKSEIPSIEGLASEAYVDEKIAAIPEVDLSGYALKSEIPDVSGFITDSEADTKISTAVSSAEERVDFKLGSYALKTEIPDVSGFITEIPAEYVTETELEAKGYLTEHQSLDGYAKITDIPDVSEYQTEAQVVALIQANMPASGDEVSY